MAAFRSPSSILGGGINPFHAIWAPLLGTVIQSTQAPPEPSGGPPPSPPQPSEPSQPSNPSSPSSPADPAAPQESAAPRRRGRRSLIVTSLRGVLTPRPDGLARKTLLGE